eukprot:scaffold39541_cov18-Tisochrysis_lutea.AAC.7
MLKQLLTRRFPVDQSTGQLQPSNDRGGMPGIDTTKALMQVPLPAAAAVVCVCGDMDANFTDLT